MRTYLAFYQGKQVTVQANKTYDAQKQAAQLLKVKESKRYMITIALADVTHVPTD